MFSDVLMYCHPIQQISKCFFSTIHNSEAKILLLKDKLFQMEENVNSFFHEARKISRHFIVGHQLQ